MTAGTFTIYTRNLGAINIDDLLAADVRMALVGSAYTPDFDETSGHYLWADVSANEIANGNGYITGGVALTSMVKTAIANGFKFASAYANWDASGGNIPAWRRGVMYVNGTLWGLTNPLIGAVLGDVTPADIPATTPPNYVRINCPSDGWFDVS